jgi:hypothetical protein
MRWNALIFFALSAFFLAGQAYGSVKPGTNQSYESCGLITAEYATVLQLLSRGISPGHLKESLPDISTKAQGRIDYLASMVKNDGLVDSYSRINGEYASCAKKVFEARGLPTPGSREAHFYRCAGENKVGYEAAIAALIGASEKEVIGQLEPQHRSGGEAVFIDLKSKGSKGMFDGLATRLKRCLAAAP